MRGFKNGDDKEVNLEHVSRLKLVLLILINSNSSSNKKVNEVGMP